MIAATSSARLLIGVSDPGERGYNAALTSSRRTSGATLGITNLRRRKVVNDVALIEGNDGKPEGGHRDAASN